MVTETVAIDPALLALVTGDARARLAAIDAVDDDDVSAHALRDLLLRDASAHLRARAAERLAAMGQGAAWLREAAGDHKPLVREAAIRGLARLGDGDAVAGLVHSCANEPIWWVRRAAVVAVAVIAGKAALSALRDVLTDPFWRVRHAAIVALAMLGDGDRDVRERLLSDAATSGDTVRAALEFLRRRWQGGDATTLIAAPPEPIIAADDELYDADPAVMSAMLEDRARPVAPARLVELLADPHQQLRELASSRLIAYGDVRSARAALIWLDEPRIPHAAATAAAMLDGLGDRAGELAAEVLSDDAGSPAAQLWALAWVARSRSLDLVDEVSGLIGARDPRVRAAALTVLLGLDGSRRDVVATGLVDSAAAVRAAAIAELSRFPALAGGSIDELTERAQSVAARRQLVAVAARAGNRSALVRLAGDSDARVRAGALAVLARRGQLDPAVADRAAGDADPWIRAAVIADPERALTVLATDSDVIVRRLALTWLVGHRDLISLSQRQQIAEFAAAALDPWQRARAPLFVGDSAADVGVLLALSADSTAMVRAAAADALDEVDRDVLRGLLASEEAGIAGAALVWLCRDLDEAAAAELIGNAANPAAQVVAAAVSGEAVAPPRVAPPTRGAEPSVPARGVRRQLGSSTIELAPLVISGANELSPLAYRAAFERGVNGFFWEPRYLGLTRFLRGSRARRQATTIVAGSYEASARAIEASVDAALRRLATDYLDLFLLFWVRSPARVDERAFACLERLKEAGKVRAVGFSTHHRDLAVRAIDEHPWDALMVRHSAAHRGAEDELFAAAGRRGVGILTFSALCYQRMLRGVGAPSAADCYRYSLTRPEVTATISAPRRRRELDHNLEVLERATLSADELVAIRVHGARVYTGNKDFAALVRRTPIEIPNATTRRLRALLDELGEEPRGLW